MPLNSERSGGESQAGALLVAWPLCSCIMHLKLSNLPGPWELYLYKGPKCFPPRKFPDSHYYSESWAGTTNM